MVDAGVAGAVTAPALASWSKATCCNPLTSARAKPNFTTNVPSLLADHRKLVLEVKVQSAPAAGLEFMIMRGVC